MKRPAPSPRPSNCCGPASRNRLLRSRGRARGASAVGAGNRTPGGPPTANAARSSVGASDLDAILSPLARSLESKIDLPEQLVRFHGVGRIARNTGSQTTFEVLWQGSAKSFDDPDGTVLGRVLEYETDLAVAQNACGVALAESRCENVRDIIVASQSTAVVASDAQAYHGQGLEESSGSHHTASCCDFEVVGGEKRSLVALSLGAGRRNADGLSVGECKVTLATTARRRLSRSPHDGEGADERAHTGDEPEYDDIENYRTKPDPEAGEAGGETHQTASIDDRRLRTLVFAHSRPIPGDKGFSDHGTL